MLSHPVGVVEMPYLSVFKMFIFLWYTKEVLIAELYKASGMPIIQSWLINLELYDNGKTISSAEMCAHEQQKPGMFC